MKNIILKTITAIATLLAILSACALDSDTYIPYAVLIGCMVWLGLFLYVNRERYLHD